MRFWPALRLLLGLDWTFAATYNHCRYKLKGGVEMRTKIQKWGNSMAVRIPRSFAAEASLREGAPVSLTLRDGRLIIELVPPEAHTLEGLISQVKETNLHQDYATGKPMGLELW